MPPPTILAHKTDFLTSQTLQLSRTLSPSNAWRASNANNKRQAPATNENQSRNENANPLPEKAIDDALYRLNHALQQHTRRVYAPQATRHVAEQIEALYLEAGERGVRAGDSESEEGDEDGEGDGEVVSREEGRGRLRVGVDLTTDEIISSLPPTWSQNPYNPTRAASQAEAYPPEAQRYVELATRLATLSTRRKEARERVARLRRMHDLLAPFRDDSGGGDENSDGNADRDGKGGVRGGVVQPNLVTRNGEIEKELERMRFLLVRVAGRVARLPPPPQQSQRDGGGGGGGGGGKRKRKGRDDDEVVEVLDNGVQDLDVLEKRKVDRLLDGL